MFVLKALRDALAGVEETVEQPPVTPAVSRGSELARKPLGSRSRNAQLGAGVNATPRRRNAKTADADTPAKKKTPAVRKVGGGKKAEQDENQDKKPGGVQGRKAKGAQATSSSSPSSSSYSPLKANLDKYRPVITIIETDDDASDDGSAKLPEALTGAKKPPKEKPATPAKTPRTRRASSSSSSSIPGSFPGSDSEQEASEGVSSSMREVVVVVVERKSQTLDVPHHRRPAKKRHSYGGYAAPPSPIYDLNDSNEDFDGDSDREFVRNNQGSGALFAAARFVHINAKKEEESRPLPVPSEELRKRYKENYLYVLDDLEPHHKSSFIKQILSPYSKDNGRGHAYILLVHTSVPLLEGHILIKIGQTSRRAQDRARENTACWPGGTVAVHGSWGVSPRRKSLEAFVKKELLLRRGGGDGGGGGCHRVPRCGNVACAKTHEEYFLVHEETGLRELEAVFEKWHRWVCVRDFFEVLQATEAAKGDEGFPGAAETTKESARAVAKSARAAAKARRTTIY